jgi:protein-ribulosamine 3-kinase
VSRARHPGTPHSAQGRSGRRSAGPGSHAAVARALSQVLDTWVAPQPAAPVGGGSINDGFRWESGAGSLFVKVSRGAAAQMFAAEAAGLAELAQARAVRVPRVLAQGEAGGEAYLALEWLDLRPLSRTAQRLLGERLAQQHRRTAERHGWRRDNTIGSTPQKNPWCDDWGRFFIEHRLVFQLELALRNGHGGRLEARSDELLRCAEELLRGHAPPPSLLHGDLWGGNAAAIPGEEPVIFDPAVYYGDRETDIAMTRLFGGFGPEFHAAYEAAWPLPPGAGRRADLYNLYHILNHVNLFGAGYLGHAMSLIDSVLARD